QQRYPKIDEGKKVDISGKDVGSGKSPESSYNGNFYTTTNKNEIAEKVTQSKDGISTKSSTVWFIVGDRNDDDMFNISHMKRYRSEEHTSELQSRFDIVCRLLLEKK